MEKILLALDAVNPDKNSMDLAIYLGQLTKSSVTGVFLENLVSDEKPVFRTMQGRPYVDWQVDSESAVYQQKRQIIEESMATFKRTCEMEKVGYVIHSDEGVPKREIIEETRFADVAVVSPTTDFNSESGIPSKFVQQLLRRAECPVIIGPGNFGGIEEIIFTYNGSKSSLFAIKQFTYLFPEFREKKVCVLYVHGQEGWMYEDKKYFKEWLHDHYSSFRFEDLKGDTEDNLYDYLFKLQNRFIVMGAYGRSSLSRWLKPSLADLVIKTSTQPVFISHY